jgi:hypothetical protein
MLDFPEGVESSAREDTEWDERQNGQTPGRREAEHVGRPGGTEKQ